MLIDTLKNKETPVSQMLQEYFQFKYERLHQKLDNEIRQNFLGEETPIGDQVDLKYDLGTPILLNNIGYRIH